MITARAIEAIESSDTDELIRVIDGYCLTGAWDELVELRTRCREAVTRGRQLWGVEEHIRYRLALESPPRWAGPVVSEGPARFALGPLPEVAASTKTWVEMAPHLGHGPERSSFAAERVVRGEDGVEQIVDLPNQLQQWEPVWPVASYKPDKIDAPSPVPPHVSETELPETLHVLNDPDSEAALADLVLPWTNESDGRCQVVSVEGGALEAVRALGLSRARVGQITHGEALAWMGWAGASGGAHGRRRGAAAGRYGAWWVVATLCDLAWPPDPNDVGRCATQMRWHWFDDGAPATGWTLRLAIEDPATGLAWAISAIDQAD